MSPCAEIVLRTEHPRLTPSHRRVDPGAGIGAVGAEVGVEELGLVGVGITAHGRDGRGLDIGPTFVGEARQGRGETRCGRVDIGQVLLERASLAVGQQPGELVARSPARLAQRPHRSLAPVDGPEVSSAAIAARNASSPAAIFRASASTSSTSPSGMTTAPAASA
jgi:hypothetical protein